MLFINQYFIPPPPIGLTNFRRVMLLAHKLTMSETSLGQKVFYTAQVCLPGNQLGVQSLIMDLNLNCQEEEVKNCLAVKITNFA